MPIKHPIRRVGFLCEASPRFQVNSTRSMFEMGEQASLRSSFRRELEEHKNRHAPSSGASTSRISEIDEAPGSTRRDEFDGEPDLQSMRTVHSDVTVQLDPEGEEPADSDQPFENNNIIFKNRAQFDHLAAAGALNKKAYHWGDPTKLVKPSVWLTTGLLISVGKVVANNIRALAPGSDVDPLDRSWHQIVFERTDTLQGVIKGGSAGNALTLVVDGGDELAAGLQASGVPANALNAIQAFVIYPLFHFIVHFGYEGSKEQWSSDVEWAQELEKELSDLTNELQAHNVTLLPKGLKREEIHAMQATLQALTPEQRELAIDLVVKYLTIQRDHKNVQAKNRLANPTITIGTGLMMYAIDAYWGPSILNFASSLFTKNTPGVIKTFSDVSDWTGKVLIPVGQLVMLGFGTGAFYSGLQENRALNEDRRAIEQSKLIDSATKQELIAIIKAKRGWNNLGSIGAGLGLAIGQGLMAAGSVIHFSSAPGVAYNPLIVSGGLVTIGAIGMRIYGDTKASKRYDGAGEIDAEEVHEFKLAYAADRAGGTTQHTLHLRQRDQAIYADMKQLEPLSKTFNKLFHRRDQAQDRETFLKHVCERLYQEIHKIVTARHIALDRTDPDPQDGDSLETHALALLKKMDSLDLGSLVEQGVVTDVVLKDLKWRSVRRKHPHYIVIDEVKAKRESVIPILDLILNKMCGWESVGYPLLDHRYGVRLATRPKNITFRERNFAVPIPKLEFYRSTHKDVHTYELNSEALRRDLGNYGLNPQPSPNSNSDDASTSGDTGRASSDASIHEMAELVIKNTLKVLAHDYKYSARAGKFTANEQLIALSKAELIHSWIDERNAQTEASA